MVRKFKEVIILVKLLITAFIASIKDKSIRFWFGQTVGDIYCLEIMRAEKVNPADWFRILEFVNFDLEILRTTIQTSGFKCLEEATKDVIWRYDVFTNKLRAIKVK